MQKISCKPQNHLAVYRRFKDKDYISWMLEGSKTLDIKFSYHKIAPYGYLKSGDYIYIKEAAGPVVGRCKVAVVKSVEVTDPGRILEALLTNWEALGMRDEEHAYSYFQKVMGKRYMTIFTLTEPTALKHPVHIEKHDRRVWVPNYQLPAELAFSFGLVPEIL